VLATQEAREVTGPVHNTIVFAVLLMILSFLMLSLLAAYVYLHRKQRLEDIETQQEEEQEKEEHHLVAV
jgi:predicted histidine transporter YuiF (NhaC family)